jgi:stearoyl-CoA desaturase (delta-9 desaturase)
MMSPANAAANRAANMLGILLIHIGAVVAIARGGSLRMFALAAALFAVRMIGITVCYHRCLAHRAFDTSRVMRCLFALLGTTCVQKGPIWWVSMHRAHHKNADRPDDPHSPHNHGGGFWTAHLLWWMRPDHEAVRAELVRDLLKYPELRFLDRWHFLGSLVPIFALAATLGWDGVLFGYALSTVLLHHVVFSINSVTHLWGSRPYATHDESRNVALLGILGLGEGWHNNHHAFPRCARFGHRVWQLDVGWLVIRALAALGLVWNVRASIEARKRTDGAAARREA